MQYIKKMGENLSIILKRSFSKASLFFEKYKKLFEVSIFFTYVSVREVRRCIYRGPHVFFPI